ncbi:MAG: 6-phosphofructokinase [Planctomycetes bacterium]|nr:6-phosphofructokinase [Planctomycetota bacterium]
MKRIGILTAGGDTPALNATLYGAVQRANALHVDVLGLLKGFASLLDPRVPHVLLNPSLSTIAQLDPCQGGTILGASRTYLDPDKPDELKHIIDRLHRLQIEGLVCVGGDGTLNAMQVLADEFPCVLAPKTIDNDLGLNYIDEPEEWQTADSSTDPKPNSHNRSGREQIDPAEIINYVTPGFATAVFVVAQGIRRIRTTAESHRRIAIIEVMGRQSGYIALGSAYGQPDMILIPEVPIVYSQVEKRIRELYAQQEHVVIVIGEGVVDESGRELGTADKSTDPAGTVLYSGAAEALKTILTETLGDDFLKRHRQQETGSSMIFTRKVGHTQRGGRPIQFDRSCAKQLGAKAVDLLAEGAHNTMATFQWSSERGFFLDSIPADTLRDRQKVIRPRLVHLSLYDAENFRPSELGVQYLLPIFTDAIGVDDMEFLRTELFNPNNPADRYRSINVEIQKKTEFLEES